MKKKLLTITLSLTLLLAGCVQEDGAAAPPPSTAAPTISTQESSPSQPEEKGPLALMDVSSTDWSGIRGKIRGIHSAGNGKVLILADQLNLYDTVSGENITAPVEALEAIYCRCWAFDSGYVVAGFPSAPEDDGDTAPQLRVIFYDTDLKKTSELDWSKLLDEGDEIITQQALDFSSDGSRMVYATLSGLYLYDLPQQKRSMLLDPTAEDRVSISRIAGVEQVGFTNGEKSVAFRATSLAVPAVPGQKSFDTIGMIHTDGSGFTNEKPNGYAAKKLIAYDSRLLIAEDFVTATGRIMTIDSKSGEENIFNLSDSKEGGNIYGSDNGRYFASSLQAQGGWTVRVYDAETGKQLKEQFVSNDGKEEYGYNDPIFCILDETRACVVYMGRRQTGVPTKVEVISF